LISRFSRLRNINVSFHRSSYRVEIISRRSRDWRSNKSAKLIVTPLRFSVAAGRLAVSWWDFNIEIEGSLLRSLCRCAQCRAAVLSGQPLTTAKTPRVAITALSPLNYGPQLHFDDGHARGIFSWAYLREIAERETVALACI
jgi:DUF971 family protein